MKKVIIGIIILIAFIGGLICYGNKSTTTQCNLIELSDGVYAIQSIVVSAIPAENYSMLTVCSESGNVITVKGSCNIIYTDTDAPYAIIKNTNLVNNDEITVYVPQSTVEYMGTSSIGGRR